MITLFFTFICHNSLHYYKFAASQYNQHMVTSGTSSIQMHFNSSSILLQYHHYKLMNILYYNGLSLHNTDPCKVSLLYKWHSYVFPLFCFQAIKDTVSLDDFCSQSIAKTSHFSTKLPTLPTKRPNKNISGTYIFLRSYILTQTLN
jgi:hypothetical protein